MLSHTRYSRSPALLMSIISPKTRDLSTTWKATVKPVVSVLMLITVAVCAGCASGSALVTGQSRPAIADHTTVAILTEMPDDADPIAMLKASSDSGWTQQGSLDYALEELKKQAAKVGANAVVLAARETTTQTVGIPTDKGGTFISSFDTEIVQGTAIWVD